MNERENIAFDTDLGNDAKLELVVEEAFAFLRPLLSQYGVLIFSTPPLPPLRHHHHHPRSGRFYSYCHPSSSTNAKRVNTNVAAWDKGREMDLGEIRK